MQIHKPLGNMLLNSLLLLSKLSRPCLIVIFTLSDIPKFFTEKKGSGVRILTGSPEYAPSQSNKYFIIFYFPFIPKDISP